MKPYPALLEKLIRKNQTPFAQYVLFDSNRVLYEFSGGYANLGIKQPVTDNTVFPIFSITKTFTALAILQLSETRRVELNASVNHYLHDIPLGDTVTVKHLLTHTAGLSNPFPLNWIHTPKEHASFDRNGFFRPVILKSIRNRQPEMKFSYSNIGYVLLGQIIESVYGSAYESYISTHILDKLKTPEKILTFEPDESKLATGYHKSMSLSMLLLRMMFDSRKYMGTAYDGWKPFGSFYLNGSSYGGLFANRNGMVKYGQEIMKDPCKLISGESKELMLTENITNNGKPTGMCLAWFKGRINNYNYYSHAGGGGGFYCELRIYPEIQKGSFIIFNRSGFSDLRILSKIDPELIS